PLVTLRHRYLTRQLEALRTRVAMLGGKRLTFDEESKALYDAVAPHHAAAEFDGVLAQLEQLPRPLREPPGPPRRDVQGRHRRLPPPHAGARRPAARREFHGGIRHQQEL